MTTTTPIVTRLKLPAFRSFVESTAWAIHPERGRALLDMLEARARDRLALSPAANDTIAVRQAGRSDQRTVTKSGGLIAVLPMYGVIAQRFDMMMAYCGGTSTEAFADAFDAAMADPNVSAIVIDCDSPGGSVQGTPELAKRIMNARGKGKQIVAVSNGCMASAAYWICSAADEVVASPSAEVGSIGVFCVHVDQSAMNEMVGLKYTLIKAGDHKAEMNPWEPLSPDAKEFALGQVEEMNDMFVGAVAKQRGTSTKAINDDYGQGRCFTAKQALAAGMIDRIATLEDTLKRLGAKNVGASGRPVQASALSAPPVAVNALQQPTGTRLVRSADANPADPADPSDPAEDDNDLEASDDLCPECGAELDDDGVCPDCGYVATKKTGDTPPADDGNDDSGSGDQPDDQQNDQSKKKNSLASATGPDAASSITAPGPQLAEDTTMDEQVKAAVEAERKRVADIRGVGRTHKIDEKEIDALIDSGVSYSAATEHFLSKIRDRHTAGPVITVGADRAAEKPFTSFGEQLVAVVQAGRPGGRRDPRLDRVNAMAQMQAGTPSGMNESVGSEGGFFIQNDLLPEVIEPVYTDDPILSRVTRIPVGQGKNGVIYNVVDESARTDGSRWGGIRMIWGDEADSPAATKPKLRRVEHNLKKLIGLAYLTDELMEDAPAAQKLLTDAFQAENRFMLASAVFRGPGGGQPLGFLNSKATVSVAIEATQTIANTATFVGLNVTKMLSRIPAALWDDVIFLYNQELLPYLVNATIGTNGTVPLFIGAGGLVNRPFDTILGKPAFASEQCEAVGTPGDIVAVAPSQYHMTDKGGPQTAMSLHVRFLFDEAVLRITQRVDGKPVWNTTVTPYKGANARSPFITLAVRS